MTTEKESAPNWEGLPDSTEHRTVGPHRAWSYADAEWCYPDSLCWTCDQTQVPSGWKGYHVGAILAELREKVAALRDEAQSCAEDDSLSQSDQNIWKTKALAYARVVGLFDGGKR